MMAEITSEVIFRVAELHRTIKEQAGEIERLQSLAVRAWYSCRCGGLRVVDGCYGGLTSRDDKELKRLAEAAKIRGPDSVAATIAEAERQAKIPKMPNEREDEPIE